MITSPLSKKTMGVVAKRSSNWDPLKSSGGMFGFLGSLGLRPAPFHISVGKKSITNPRDRYIRGGSRRGVERALLQTQQREPQQEAGPMRAG
jgi:hypothetical protein